MNRLGVLSAIGIVIGGAGMIGSSLIAEADNGSPVATTGQGGERTYAAAGFERVSAVGPQEVAVKVGPAFSVSATGDADALDRYEVVVRGGALRIQPRHGAWWDIDWSNRKPVTFTVTLPQISAASFVGSGEMKIDRVEGNRFEANLAGSGHMDIAELAVDNARFSVAGSGDLSANGKARDAHVSVAGSGDMRATGLAIDTAHVSIAGSGDAELTVKDDAHVSTVGNGDVTISGTARCTVSRIGAGSVRCPNQG